MTDQQIQIADELLKYLYERKGYTYVHDVPEYLNEKFDEPHEVRQVTKTLEEQNLITYDGETILRLTENGNKAAKIGYQKYMDKLENEHSMQLDSYLAARDTATWSKRYAIAAVIISIIAIIVSIIALTKQ